jgi:hypothetical protein
MTIPSTYFRPILAIGEQPQLLEYIKDLDYSQDPVVLVPEAQAQAIVDSLGWPRGPGLHVLACRLEPMARSAIHRDVNEDGTSGLIWALNVPIKDSWGTWMEWFAAKGEGPEHYYNIANPVDGTNVPALKRASAKPLSSAKGVDTGYVARNDIWHCIMNYSDRTSWCVSIRYYPLSFESWDQVSRTTPWLAAIAKKGKP